MIHCFRKHNRAYHSNYRQDSIQPNASKISEFVFDWFPDNLYLTSLSTLGFSKISSSVAIINNSHKKWENVLGKNDTFRALLTELSETFDSRNHELLLAKFHHTNGFDNHVLNLIYSYLTERIKNLLRGDASTPWKDIVIGVPKGFIHFCLLWE